MAIRMAAQIGWGLMMMGAAVATAAAAPAAPAPASAIDTLLNCLDVPDAGARLSCFETQARALKGATQRKDVVVLDQAEIQKTRRSLFGFTLPHIALFDAPAQRDAKGREKKETAPDLDRLQTTLRSVSRDGNGLWVLVLEDGARWQQIESGRDVDEPRAGMPIDIRRATMGSYFARISGSIFLRVRRVS